MAFVWPICVVSRAARLALLAGCFVLLSPLSTAAAETPADDDDIDWQKERQFWSFQPPRSTPLPVVKAKRWPRQELDHFVLARLESKRLSPSAEAGKPALIRRVTFDLTGLPPTPAEIEEFLSDKKPEAYNRLVDRLLASPRFGERMASLWLPLARFAEDQAHQVGSDTKFFYPNAYKYRDWVIESFNRDMPYSDFIQLQLAADKLDRTNDLAALGFLGLGPKYYNRGRLEVMADEWEDRVDTVTRTFLGLTVACARCHDHKFDPITREDYYGLAGVFASTKMVNKVPGGDVDKADKADKMTPATLHIIDDDKPQDLNVFFRGNVQRKGPIAPRQFLRVLSEAPIAFTNGSGRRELAAAIASADNPLTARVMVNRVWGELFGRSIVESPSNFGHSGQPPGNRELLDFLAVRFVEQGWSVKSLARDFVLSATYRQDSAFNRKAAVVDPSNELLWRMNRKRLSVEQFRDALLYTSGELDFASGPSMELDDPKNLRRTVHARISRLQLNSTLMSFDYPDANVHAEKRAVTTSAMQKLFALNSPFVIDRARTLAGRVAEQAGESSDDRVRLVYQTLFARKPDREELKIAADFLRKPEGGDFSRWQQYVQMLFASNEMLYVD